ncbi:MAG: flavin-containing monooxygenase [Solirubrobacteraceae bacterium]
MSDGGAGARVVQVAIVGAGLAGLGMGIMLRRAGIDDFEILERAHEVGGTWRANSYPGCCVDVQSHLYSYSLAPNPDWTYVYAPQAEIWGYARRCAERFGVLGSVRFGHEVLAAVWDDERERWLVTTTAGTVVARYLVSAVGPLSAQALPDIPGLDTFQGARFHSAAWDHDHDLAGERVAVIGTGASAAQIIPGIQAYVERLLVFQRTPSWTFPRLNRRITRLERAAYRRLPVLQRCARAAVLVPGIARNHAAAPVAHAGAGGAHGCGCGARFRRPRWRCQLTPRYRVGCKRIIVSDDYHQTFTRSNVELITSPIEAVREYSIATRDGCERGVDAMFSRRVFIRSR